jgi:hypothetical protein
MTIVADSSIMMKSFGMQKSVPLASLHGQDSKSMFYKQNRWYPKKVKKTIEDCYMQWYYNPIIQKCCT